MVGKDLEQQELFDSKPAVIAKEEEQTCYHDNNNNNKDVDKKEDDDEMVILPGLSEHQAAVIDLMEAGYNVKVFAHPGCGKSTLITQIVLSFPRKRILIVSFNTALVASTLEMIYEKATNRDFGQYDVCVQTFHGLMSSLAKEVIHNDTLLWDALVYMNFDVLGRNWSHNDFDILVIDESQDLRKFFLILLFKVLLEVHPNRHKVQVVLLGDVEQLLYNFFALNPADQRYFTKAHHFFGQVLPARPWKNAILPVSYRLTPQMVRFVNALLPHKQMISGNLKNHQSCITDYVELYITDVYLDAPNIIYNCIKKIVGMDMENCGSIMILFASVNENSPATKIVDKLIVEGFPVHVVRSGVLAKGNPKKTRKNNSDNNNNNNNNTDDELKDIKKGKIVVQTVSSSKGLERENVFFVNMTELLSTEFVTNPKVVGMTRARKKLFIIQNFFYVSQTQLANLIAKYPEIKQQDLQIIQTRPVPKELRKRKSREEQTKNGTCNFFSVNGLDTSSLFAFLDVQHMLDLAKHISSQIVLPSFLTTTTVDEKVQEEEEDQNSSNNSKNNTEKNLMLFNDYIDEMTISFDGGKTFTNVNNICNTALQLAIEFGCTKGQKHLVKIKMIQNVVQSKQDAMFVLMRERIYDAFEILFSSDNEFESLEPKKQNIEEETVYDYYEENNEKIVKGLCQRMAAFANLAIVCDAYQGYKEYLRVVNNYDFILKSQNIHSRVQALWNGFHNLCAQYSQDKANLEWYKEETGRFLYKDECVQLKIHPCVMNTERNFIIMFSNNVATNEDDRFAAAVTALVLHDPSISSEFPNIHIINLFDASVEKVTIVSDFIQHFIPTPEEEEQQQQQKEDDDVQQSKEEKQQLNNNDLQTEKLEQESQKRRKLDTTNSAAACCSKTKKEPGSQKRRRLCSFLESAISFKVARNDIEEKCEIKQGEVYDKEDEQEFEQKHQYEHQNRYDYDSKSDIIFIKAFQQEIQELIDSVDGCCDDHNNEINPGNNYCEKEEREEEEEEGLNNKEEQEEQEELEQPKKDFAYDEY